MTRPADHYITRREVLRLWLATIGMGLGVAGCSGARLSQTAAAGAAERITRGLFFRAEELAQLAEIAEIIIPATDTPGARGAGVPGFIDRMMTEWAVPQTQAALRTALSEIEASAVERFGKAFMSLSAEQRLEVVAGVDAAAFHQKRPEGEGQRVPAFARLKELVFLGYYHSEIGATEALQYQPVPGSYEGCVPLSKIGRAWAEPI